MGVDLLLDKIIKEVPSPSLIDDGIFKGFLVDSQFVKDKGVILIINVKSGTIKKGDSIVSCAFNEKYEVFEVYCFTIQW